MFKILSGSDTSDLQSKLNTEVKPFRIIAFSGNNIILEKADALKGTDIISSVSSSETAPDGSSTVTTETVNQNGKVTKTEKNFDSDGAEI